VQIDWFTFAAQIVNFLILLFLLKRFLYRPVLEAMNAREQRIADEIRQAEEKHEEAEQRAASYQQQSEEFNETRDDRMKEMNQEVKEQRKKLLREIEQDIQEKKQGWLESLQRNQESFIQELKLQIGQKAAEIARRALEDLADEDFESKMSDIFIQRLKELDLEQRSEFGGLIREERDDIVVFSSFELSQRQKDEITKAIEERILDGHSAETRFKTTDALISGIELRLNGHKISWTINEYLVGLQEKIEKAITKANQAHI
jgi:F-type H+-transporting ATPase subunit b